ncbi:prolipoprotein diacylglyceryl transferase [Kurthia sibirica]|uniref:Phosphatidylglycerol--prolipoprotein diacylglyceryl transferase n=1 Tax=Kurthia sibirica TaxID=202750 RepID=A0A2U3AJC0_9BACL|nr:prolipoprotein diacylglyceryl transferase [Kurthia sibirica]PWI24666.1 prolipoprotein diacylglyceryl transferase [Kurthia sibirica]GEK33456.1 prolipoprotein diacylglyceryl transferase [Kurthia sibirica]
MDFLLMSIDPVAIQLGPIDVRWYGIIIASGIIVAYLVGQREMIKRGFKEDTLTDLLIWAVPIAIISARIYYVIFEWGYYKDHLNEIIAIWNGGIAIHGALIGSVITALVFAKKRQLSFWKIADVLAPSILIGQIIGRWGNFMNQEAYGGVVERSFLENLYIPDWIIEQMNVAGFYHHPTFLYESLWNIIGLVLLLVLRKVNLHRGELFLIYIMWYSFGRYFVESMREDSLYIGPLRTAQMVSLIALIAAAAIFIYRRYKVKPVIKYKDK